MVDDYSRGIWTHLLSNKSNVLQVIDTLVSMVENQCQNHQVRQWARVHHHRNQSIFSGKRHYSSKKIFLHTITKDVVEEKYNYILKIVRTLLLQSQFLMKCCESTFSLLLI